MWKTFRKVALGQFEGSNGGKQLYMLEMAKEIVAKHKEAGIARKTDIIDYQ